MKRYVSEEVGLPTLQDILAELKKPGRDPRETFELPAFRDDVRELKDLTEGMMLEGIVTNIVAFGAFVDIGVHQDGLVHVSQMSDRYVADPNDIVRVGQKVKVRVVSVDMQRNRIALSMTTSDKPAAVKGQKGKNQPSKRATPPKAFQMPKSGEYAPNGMRFK
jgi:uncharacterized protein